MKDASRRRFDIVMAWSVDRLGRSLQDLVGLLSDLHAVDVDFYLDQQGIDATTPAGKALFQMMGVFAEFEREIIRERIKAGLARAKAQGKRLGRKPVGPEKEAEILRVRSQGHGIKKTAKLGQVFGAGVGTDTRHPQKRALVYGDDQAQCVRLWLIADSFHDNLKSGI